MQVWSLLSPLTRLTCKYGVSPFLCAGARMLKGLRQAVEEGEMDLQKMQREHEGKMDSYRAEAKKAQDDIRAKMHQK